ncbi:MAG: DnaD domain protein, partial [Chloroflexi bacterium]|nr:DnaD domain protein [Chloroflexota bacterium]
TRIPSLFFKDLLPQIDHLDELKVTLYALWQITRLEGEIRYLKEESFTGDPEFMAGLGATPAAQQEAVQNGLERAVNRGTLLKTAVPDGEGELVIYFFSSPRGQAAVQSVADGSWRPSDGDIPAPTLSLEQPNIFLLYEENIGPLTPLIADTLREAEAEYPQDWIRQAVEIAVQNNVRKWNYIEAILHSWQDGGRDERQDRGHTKKDRQGYLEDEFAEFIED